MFDIGFWELIILFGLGLIILGPERLPKVAMQVGNWAGQARRMARQLSGQIRSELNDINIANEIDIKDPFPPSGDGQDTPEYSRPGVDDLKPSSSVDESANLANEETPSPHSPDNEDTEAGKAS